MLGSVFTHMLPPEVENYLAEISRVMKPQGICYISYYLLNPVSLKGIEAGWSGANLFPHAHDSGKCRLSNLDYPEWCVGFDEEFIRGLYRKNGLRIEEPIIHGKWWWGVPDDQDLIKATKE